MFFERRAYNIAPFATIEEMVVELTRVDTWTLCTGFRVGGIAYLNDSTSEDGAQEYAAMLITAEDEMTLTGKYFESLTFGWMIPERITQLLKDYALFETTGLPEGYGMGGSVITVRKHLNGACRLCA